MLKKRIVKNGNENNNIAMLIASYTIAKLQKKNESTKKNG